MKTPSQDPLDALLRDWANMREPGEHDRARLTQQIVSALDDEPRDVATADTREPLLKPGRRVTVAGRLAWFGLGAAAALAVCLLLSGQRRLPTEAGPQTMAELAASCALLKSQLAGNAQLLDELERMFDGQLTWVAESEGKLSFGLSRLPKADASNAVPLVVRVLVFSRRSDQQDWSPAWTLDVVTRDEQLVTLTPENGSSGGNVSLWAYVLPDGMVAVDTDIDLPGAIPVQRTFSVIQQPGVPEAVLSTRADGVEYRVFQTVAIMDQRLG